MRAEHRVLRTPQRALSQLQLLLILLAIPQRERLYVTLLEPLSNAKYDALKSVLIRSIFTP